MQTLLPYLKTDMPEVVTTAVIQSKGRATVDGLETINELFNTNFVVSEDPFDRTDQLIDSRRSLHGLRGQ